jgi:hypothetical protein
MVTLISIITVKLIICTITGSLGITSHHGDALFGLCIVSIIIAVYQPWLFVVLLAIAVMLPFANKPHDFFIYDSCVFTRQHCLSEP